MKLKTKINHILKRLEWLRPYPEYLKKAVSSHYFWLGLILLTALLLRLKGLNFQGLWGDELTSLVSCSPERSFGRIIAHYQTDPHPPLFFLVLHYWSMLFGYNEAGARLLVALIGTGSVWAIYYLGKECFSKNAGLIGAAFTAVNFFNLYYSQEVRPYILLFLASALSYAFFIKLLREQSRRHVIYYSLWSVLLIYSHYFGLIMLMCQAIFLAYYLVMEKDTPRLSLVKHFSLSGLIIAVLYSPWIPTVLRMMGRKNHWIKNPPEPDFFIRYFQQFLGSEPYLVVVFLALFILLILRFMGVNGRDESPDPRLNLALPVLFSWAFFSLFIPYYRSVTKVPMLVPHYAIGTLPALLIMAAISLALFRQKTFKILLLTSIMLMSALNIFEHKSYYRTPVKAQWREAAKLAIEDVNGKEGIYVISRAARKYQFYFDSMAGDKKIKKIRVFPAVQASIKKIAGYKDFTGVWLLEGARGKKNLKKFLPRMRKQFRMVNEQSFKGGIKASFWEQKRDVNQN